MIVSWIKSFSKPAEERKPLFEKLMSDSYRQAYQMAYRFTSNRVDAEDLLQETYVRAYRFFHRYDETMPFTSWLYRIMTNIHIDSVRKNSRLRTVSIDQGNPETGTTWEIADDSKQADHSLVSNSLDEPFQLALKAMTPEFRMAVILADIDGMSYEEIADVMDTSVGTVRSRIHRGRKQMKEYLQASFPDSLPEVSN